MPKKRPAVRRPLRKQSRAAPDSPPFGIVGIGASAGGFEAFSQLLEGLPENPNLALVLVQHLAPRHDSALAALLDIHSQLPVVEVTEGVELERNHVYVIPPNAQMELVDGHLHLAPRPVDKSQYTPIDYFFRSLARTLRSRAIGVILSGTASDGALGIREIKAQGGIALVQEPSTARYDGMPRAALATNMVDLVLPPEKLGAKLVQVASHPLLAVNVAEVEPPRLVRQDQLDRVFDLLQAACGINFHQYKSPTIVRRLLRRMALLRINEVNDYISHLEQTPAEVVNLHNDLLIHVTRFFREPETFDVLAERMLPEIVPGTHPATPVRAWVAGCATGEEAYSLAIVLLDFLDSRSITAQLQVFGTDVSETAIEYARHGLYPSTIEADVSVDRLRRFFNKADGGYRVNKRVRDCCVFARQDLTRDPPFSRLDLISCRNVMIYMDAALQKKLLSVFHYALKPTGILLLGHVETTGYNTDLFSVMDKKHRFYRKRSGASPVAIDVPRAPVRSKDSASAPQPEARSAVRTIVSEANRVVLDRYAPPSVLVDDSLHVVQFSGQTGPFLEPSPGEPSFHVLKLAREGLLHGLRTGLQAARKSRRTVRKPGLSVKSGGKAVDVDVEIVPVPYQGRTFYLILFEPAQPASTATSARKRVPKPTGTRTQRMLKLEEELAATREYLQSTIQEIEAANEELQSANEEILSSNEELQSTNEELDTAREELQSSNEELNTVNDELHGRNDELTRSNADLINLLASVQIAIVIVSSDLRIRRFTPMAEHVLNLLPSDLGRPFSHITPSIVYPGLTELVAETIETMTAIERDVQDRSGRWYSLRIRPYKDADNRIDGAILALFDIDAAKQSTQHIKDAIGFAQMIIETAREPLMLLDGSLRIRTVNAAFSAAFRVPRGAAEQRFIYDLGAGEWNVPDLMKLLRDVLPNQRFIEGFRLEADFSDLGHRAFLLRAREIVEPGEDVHGLILLSFEDVTSKPGSSPQSPSTPRQ